MHGILTAVTHMSDKIRYDDQWKDNVKWVANAFVFISAIGVSISIEMSMSILPFFGFFIAHILWVWVALIIKDNPLIALNLFFLPLDLWAMWIRL